MWYIWLPLYQRKLTKVAIISVKRENKRMTLVMTPSIACYLVQWQPDSNHELSIKVTKLSKRNWSIECYAYHGILIFSIIPNISSVTTFLLLFFAYCPKNTILYAILYLWLFVLVICRYFLRPTVCNRQNRFGNMTGLPHENGTQFCISAKNFVSTEYSIFQEWTHYVNARPISHQHCTHGIFHTKINLRLLGHWDGLQWQDLVVTEEPSRSVVGTSWTAKYWKPREGQGYKEMISN